MLLKTFVSLALALYSCNATMTLPMKRVSLDSTSLLAKKVTKRNAHLGFTTHTQRNSFGSYIIDFAVGRPALHTHLAVDSGSAITFFGVEHGYTKTKTTRNTSIPFSENFGDSSGISGFLVRDQISFAKDITFDGYLGAAFVSKFFQSTEPGTPGLLGLGNRAMFDQTLGNNSNAIPTAVESMQNAKVIDEKIVTLNLREPASIHFGGADLSKSKGPVGYMPRKDIGSVSYWACDVYMPSLGVTAKRNENATSLIDSGTELTFLARAPLLVYYEKIKEIGGSYNASNNFFQYPKGALPPTIDLTIGDTLLPLSGEAQTLPEALKIPNELDMSLDYSIILPARDGATTSLIGSTLLSHYSVIFDSEKDRIGFALRA
ncbi:uncharacterized protein L969DRAFT_50334 [Mixia osmundae IAM 14324]|uniref:Peptidase A1 domain-containing protein n=1 Tax=Mixia osmundae (strain CBS 9802 / IAM 14324 / JCM 22182 / KY 12970) TaxID=764103 RepID=G7E1C4_MIXOS|nr:uncharacterized protein L969DRAFT_50334 [Mixia osmundae IAM 14324]KEI38728.1 hypothetical protein L969DRAFT_50334 [Mixia osmundae IAM 14324]GAA96634.1 hypothetical protein E5Q_03304 [Mixia osmundae IAM 14324]